MDSLIRQLAGYLAAEGVGPLEGASEGAIFYGAMPARPHKAIAVYASDLRYPGAPEGALVQIYVRGGENGAWALMKACEIVALLQDARQLLMAGDGFYIHGVRLLSGPSFVGLEGNGTQAYSMNFRVHYC